jgi:class 3 adenylate cyclase
LSHNAAFERIFPKTEPDSDLRTFFHAPEFRGDSTPLFAQPAKEATLEYHAESTVFIKVQPASVAQHFIFTIRDVTQQVLYHALIKEERAKSDAMLASILPANLVPRVQAGESNISFAVQSASVSFMDIVEFTPWCAANTASTVMTSLNALYRDFDALCLSKATMTKIKCIGDCYMAAGGIFSELNQPAVHAKEMVEFGLGSIAAVIKVNGEIGQSLRIRVGINTGGPLVAGVLGTEKPTFEILVPVINMAQQMEHEGVPMLVHISRATYELVYGGNFMIKERGQIEIKQGKVVTYLVEGQKNE